MKTTTELMGKRIKAERERLKLSQTALANKIGLNEEFKSDLRGIVSRWELGKGKPSAEHLVKLCGLFGCEIGYLFGEIEEQTRAASDIQAASRLDVRAVDVLINGARGKDGNALMLSNPDFDRLFLRGLNSLIADCPDIAVIVAAYVFGQGQNSYTYDKITVGDEEIPAFVSDITLRGGLMRELQRQLDQYRLTVANNGGVAPLDGVTKANENTTARQATYDALNPHINKGTAILGTGQYQQGGVGNGNDKK